MTADREMAINTINQVAEISFDIKAKLLSENNTSEELSEMLWKIVDLKALVEVLEHRVAQIDEWQCECE